MFLSFGDELEEEARKGGSEAEKEVENF